ncbi:sarcosine oxidase subunit delta [Pseudoponticoccus marisrubri]|uniref:Sarcosine oxidase subunit delta n=1 Tax=Pseudoponticoccus marisrubri TaxID=1685382 RepID=A0A0W7WFA5_9RHOB|nr:sarcosine oxidase subunit delta [Pseudoponticoccus marisrubri]KUF09257.1 sarcosine oxidase subunit delta [Pseudoponticoccus marisrubri]
MRLSCPLCGERDRREFTYQGAAAMVDRPAPGATTEQWSDWLHLRDNPAGRTRDLWYHEAGCGAWLVVERDTVTHEIFGTALVGGDHAD